VKIIAMKSKESLKKEGMRIYMHRLLIEWAEGLLSEVFGLDQTADPVIFTAAKIHLTRTRCTLILC
jgi:hypothetical protein